MAPLFSFYGISVFGAIAHNLGQLIVAYIVIQNVHLILYYLPFLVLAAIPIGLLTGFIFAKLLPHLPIKKEKR